MGKKKKMTKRQRQKRKIIRTIVVILVMLVMLVLAFVILKFGKMDKIKLDNVKTNEGLDDSALKGYTTIAVFGLDNRTTGSFKTGNSDTIIIVSIDNKTGEIKMASVYRDTYMDIGEDKFRKANAAYMAGGPEQAVNMLNRNLDLAISDYVSVDFNALVEAIDLLGGLEIDVAEDEAAAMKKVMSEMNRIFGTNEPNVSAGTQVLNGIQATAYARIRKTEGWDYKRTERQRLVITKMFEKAKKTDLITLNNMLDTVLPDVSTSLSNTELLTMIAKIGTYEMGENTGFPFEKTSAKVGKLGSVVIPIDLADNVRQLHAFLYDNEEYTVSNTVQMISDTIHSNTGY